jgi:hypothetical protein
MRYTQPHFHDQGNSAPPQFLVKFTNVPPYFGAVEMEDLFKSRFTRFVKLKLFWEIDFQELKHAADPLGALDMNVKICYVELETMESMNKVLRWTDLYANGRQKMIPMRGDFDELRTYHEINQRVSEHDDPNISGSPRRSMRPPPVRSPMQHPTPLYRAPPPQRAHDHIHELPPLRVPQPAPTPRKVNPFGAAKPVDTLSKELELEKKLHQLEINKTTFRTLGSIQKRSEFGSESKADLKLEVKTETKTETKNDRRQKSYPDTKPALVAASAPQSVWGAPASYSQVASPPKSSFAADLSKTTFSQKKEEPGKSKGKVILKRRHKEKKEPTKAVEESLQRVEEPAKPKMAAKTKHDATEGQRETKPTTFERREKKSKERRDKDKKESRKAAAESTDEKKTDLTDRPSVQQEKETEGGKKPSNRQSLDDSSRESTETEDQSNGSDVNVITGRGRGSRRGRGRGGRRGRGRDLNGTSREDSRDGSSESPEKQTFEKSDKPEKPEKSKPKPIVPELNPQNGEKLTKATDETANETTNQSSERPRGRGGFRGRGRGRGRGHFRNQTKTFRHEKGETAKQGEP